MRAFLHIFFLLLSGVCLAQHSYTFGLLPTFNANAKFQNAWKANLKIDSRLAFREGLWGDANSFDYDYQLTDLSAIFSKKIGLTNSLGLGYLSRIKEGEGELAHRFIQQFVVVKGFASFRLAHRFSSDQTFQTDHSPKFRLRYRLSTDFPLSGQTVNAKELYLKINNEYLNSFEKGKYDLEIRISPLLGYELISSKFEWGIDYRLDSFFNGHTRQRFWIKLNWYLAIDFSKS